MRRYLEMNDPTVTEADEALGDMIAASSAWFETQADRVIGIASYTDRRVGNGSSAWVAENGPVVAVQSVTVGGVPIPAEAISIEGERIVLDGYAFTRGSPCVVAYTAGYAEIPEDVAQAVTEHVALKFRDRGRFGHTYTNVTGEDIIPDQGKSGPSFAGVMSVVNSYRRMSF